MAELGLTAFLISAGLENHNWPGPRDRSLCVPQIKVASLANGLG